MIYLYENLADYSDESYLKDLNSLPTWRREKALQYKKLDDRKRSVLAFMLLQHHREICIVLWLDTRL